jgi:hypothetical protein
MQSSIQSLVSLVAYEEVLGGDFGWGLSAKIECDLTPTALRIGGRISICSTTSTTRDLDAEREHYHDSEEVYLRGLKGSASGCPWPMEE